MWLDNFLISKNMCLLSAIKFWPTVRFFFLLNIKDRKTPTTYLVPLLRICHWLAFIGSSKAILFDCKLIFSLEENETFYREYFHHVMNSTFFSSYFVASCLFCSMVRFLFYIRSVFRVWCNWPRLEQESTDVSALWKLNVKQTNSLTYK